MTSIEARRLLLNGSAVFDLPGRPVSDSTVPVVPHRGGRGDGGGPSEAVDTRIDPSPSGARSASQTAERATFPPPF